MEHIMTVVNRVPPIELFHYTDFSGLIGLVSNKQIWMGDLFFLNDEKEYQLGLELFKKQLGVLILQHAGTGFGIFLNSLSSIEELLKKRSPLSFSLTEENDLLSQWRGYTKNGIGVSVGFSSASLINGFQLLPCLYTPEEQDAYVNYLFDLAHKKFLETKEMGKYDKQHCKDPLEAQYWDAINEAGSQFISHLSVACAIIKEASFKEEKEWRLVMFDRTGVEFLAKDTYLKPIKKVGIEPLNVIKSIKVGPNPNKELCQNSIYSLLNVSNLHHVNVSLSSIPYRN